jgi:hypothetical protein
MGTGAMTVFELLTPVSTSWLIAEDRETTRRLQLRGEPRGENWVPARVSEQFVFHGEIHVPRDMPWLNASALVITDLNSRIALALEPDGEFLSLQTQARELWAFNCTTVLAGALDGRTDAEYFPGTNRIMDARKLVFDEAKIEGHHAFRVAEMKPLVFFDGWFVDLISASGLSGPDFRPVA